MRKQFKSALRGKTPTGFMGALPTEFLTGIPKDNIANVTRDVMNAFSEFADINARELIDPDFEIYDDAPEMITQLRDTLRTILNRDDIDVSYYAGGRMGDAYLIETKKFKYMLKIFKFNPKSDPHQHGAVAETEKMLLANYLNPSGSVPKLFMANANPEYGFMLTKFISPDTHKKSRMGLFKRLMMPVHSWDTIGAKEKDNVINGVIIDMGLGDIHQYLAQNNDAQKIAYEFADALDANNTEKIKKLVTKYKSHPSYQKIIDTFKRVVTTMYKNDLLHHASMGRFEYERILRDFPRDGLRVMGANLNPDEVLIPRDYGALSLHDVDENQEIFDMDMHEALRVWIKKNPPQIEEPKITNNMNTDEKRRAFFLAGNNADHRDAIEIGFQNNVTMRELIDMGYDARIVQHKFHQLSKSKKFKHATKLLTQNNKIQNIKLLFDAMRDKNVWERTK